MIGGRGPRVVLAMVQLGRLFDPLVNVPGFGTGAGILARLGASRSVVRTEEGPSEGHAKTGIVDRVSSSSSLIL